MSIDPSIRPPTRPPMRLTARRNASAAASVVQWFPSARTLRGLPSGLAGAATLALFALGATAGVMGALAFTRERRDRTMRFSDLEVDRLIVHRLSVIDDDGRPS